MNISLRPFFPAFLAILLTTVSFLPSLSNGFTNWDDSYSVTENENIRDLSWKNTAHYFLDFRHDDEDFYKPLVLLTYAVEYHFFGLDPRIYHFTNLALHLVNVFLVYYLAILLGAAPVACFFVSAFFGFHPMHVESVAWVTQRKDLLYALFFLMALIFYQTYRRTDRRRFYWFCFGFFLLSLASKPMAVTFPVVLLLLDYLAQRPLSFKLFTEKLIFFLASLAIGVLTIATASISMKSSSIMHFPGNILTMCDSLALYLEKFVLPFNLSNFYAIPKKAGYGLFLAIPSPVILMSVGMIVMFLSRYSRTILFGVLFFLINLLPTLRLAPSAFLAADHYVYIAYIGLFYPVALGIGRLSEIVRSKPLKKCLLVFFLALLLAGCGYLTFKRCGVWKDSRILWNNVLEKYRKAQTFGDRTSRPALPKWLSPPEYELTDALMNANNHLADYYISLDDYEKAVFYSSESIRLLRANAKAYSDRGYAYSQMDQPRKALRDFNRMIRQTWLDYYRATDSKESRSGKSRGGFGSRDYYLYSVAQAYVDRGALKSMMGLEKKAVADYGRALTLQPDMKEAYNNRGWSYGKIGEYARAENDYRRALEVDPGFEIGKFNLAQLQACQKKLQELEGAVNDADPFARAKAHSWRGAIYGKMGNFERALRELGQAIELDPQLISAYVTRGNVYQETRKNEQALADYSKALSLDPSLHEVYFYKYVIFGRMGRQEESHAAYQKFEELHGKIPAGEKVVIRR